MKPSKVYLLISISILLGIINSVHMQVDSFDEELFLKPLPSNHVYTYFQFTTILKSSNTPKSFQHTHLFPRGFGEIIGRHKVDELHVSLTQGLWNYQTWGYPFYDAGPGAEIYAWFNKDVSNVNQEWKGLTNAFSGLLCASLNTVNPANSMSPKFTFHPRGVYKQTPNTTHFRYSSLPREIVCTENLTPFKKLLPCNSKKGLATILNSAFIHNTNYHSLGIHFRSICGNIACTETSLELQLTVSLIYDNGLDTQDWSIRKFFGMGIKGSCPLTTISNIYLDISSNRTHQVYEITPTPTVKLKSLRGGQQNNIAVYDIKSHSVEGMFNIAVRYSTAKTAVVNYPSILHAHRYVTGSGQQKGSLVTKIYNNHWQALNIVLLENIPWYLMVYLHTIKIICNEENVIPLAIHYVPGKEGTNPYYLELILRLPPHSVTKFSIEIGYTFLKWQEYPPDANHGFYMSPAIITALLPIARNYTALPLDGSTITSSFNASRDSYFVQLRTESLLISLPTPDFSMPYNVICLACTAIALAFGPLHNITTKRLVLKSNDKSWRQQITYLFKVKILGFKEKQE